MSQPKDTISIRITQPAGAVLPKRDDDWLLQRRSIRMTDSDSASRGAAIRDEFILFSRPCGERRSRLGHGMKFARKEQRVIEM